MFKELKGCTITMNQHIGNLNEIENILKKKHMKILELKVQ